MSLNFFCEEEDNSKEESINNYKDLFSNYEKNLPTLSEALIQMFMSSNLNEQKANELTDDILSKCQKKIDQNFNEIKKKYDKILKDDAYIICAYTCESKERKYSPYKILNQNLVSDNRKNGINNISKYLYIFLKSLRKLPRYYPTKTNKYLYRSITSKVSLNKDPFNEKLVPYITGNQKTFWGFTSTSPNPEICYKFLCNKKTINKGTLFILGGDVWGYDIELFNFFGEREILLEPERKFIVDNVLPPLNEIINITCTILKSPLVLNNEIKPELISINEMENKDESNNSEINKYVIKFEMEAKINEKSNYSSGIGILCNIPSKQIKALITYNHKINFDFLNEGEKMILYIDNKEKEIDMKINRYKYTNDKLDLTIIEILEVDNINYFIEIDKFINSRDYTNKNIISVSFNDDKFDIINGLIKQKHNDNYICSIESKKEGIIILKDNLKLLGLINYNNKEKEIEFIPMNIIINVINYIKCIYEIKRDDIGKDIQIINNKDSFQFNKEIEKEIKIIMNGKIISNILTYKFNTEGLYIIYLISNNLLTNMKCMFEKCFSLKEINLLSFNTNKVTDMSSMFENCSSLKEINLSLFNTNQVSDMSFMFKNCSSLKEINLSSFNTIQVTNLSFMFKNCSSLKEINLSSFNTNQVTDMRGMFENCSSLKEINLSSFNTNQATNMLWMFDNINTSCKIKCQDDQIQKEFKEATSSCIIV